MSATFLADNAAWIAALFVWGGLCYLWGAWAENAKLRAWARAVHLVNRDFAQQLDTLKRRLRGDA